MMGDYNRLPELLLTTVDEAGSKVCINCRLNLITCDCSNVLLVVQQVNQCPRSTSIDSLKNQI